jgi:predicted acyltransferase
MIQIINAGMIRHFTFTNIFKHLLHQLSTYYSAYMEKTNQRYLPLDVFRGMTICFMIIVNTPGSGAEAFGPLQHAAWHGFTPTDLVFPSFLFAVGNAMSFSMKKFEQVSDGKFLAKVLRRTLLIFLLGYLMYWFPFFRISDAGDVISAPIADTRIMGVLQRIALCYFFASLLLRYLSTRAVYMVSILLLAGYWILLLLFGDGSDPFSMTGNAGYYIDKAVLGENHMYHGEGVAFDPEGLLSTLPAIVNVVIGYYAGIFIQRKGASYEAIARLMLTGALLIFFALCWNAFFPINKKLWTSSFVLLTTGLDLAIIGTLLYLLEIRKWNFVGWTTFFVVFGKNPLFIYLLSELLVVGLYMIHVTPNETIHQWVNRSFFQAVAPGATGSFLFAIAYMLLCWLVGYFMYRRNIYVKV